MKLRTWKFPVTTSHIFHWATLVWICMIMNIFVLERTGFSFVVLTVMALFVCDEMPKTGDLWRKTVDRRWWLQKLWTVLRIWLSDTLLNRPGRRYKTSRRKTESFAPSVCCKAIFRSLYLIIPNKCTDWRLIKGFRSCLRWSVILCLSANRRHHRVENVVDSVFNSFFFFLNANRSPCQLEKHRRYDILWFPN